MKERFKRPEPERTGPIRNWSLAYGAAYDGPQSGRPGAPPAPPPAVPPPPPPPQAPYAPQPQAADPVGRGVEAGYRVIDEYLRQGQAAARAVWSPFFPRGRETGTSGTSVAPGEHVNPWTGESAPWRGHPNDGARPQSPFPGPEDPQARMGNMLRLATDLAMMWVDFLGTSAPPQTPVPGAVPAPPFASVSSSKAPPSPAAQAPSKAPSVDERAVFSVEVESSRRVEVTADMRAPTSRKARTLRALPLRATDGDASFGGVVVEVGPEGDHVTFRLRVPSDVPPGVYVGGVLDQATSVACGFLTVRVHEAQTASE